MDAPRPLEFTSQDLSSIEQYRLRRQTSVLVILFTDIKGFTELTERRGERYALDLLKHHDEILVGTIEEGGAGLVIKHIGDSVMAVFSEPSTAVERALSIQEKIAAFNGAHPELEDIRVRIGLHMGQVAVENQTQLDLFGRHVNRASRVEGLADEGQIFLTYPVFDSARGWLQSEGASRLAWKLHGSYILKGIPEPVAIYEVVDARQRAPAAPRTGRRKSSLLPLWLGIAILIAGAALAFAVMQIQRTEVWFVNWPSEPTIVDQKTDLVLGGEPSQEARKSLTRFSMGRHVLHQNIHWQVKNYMEIDVKRGKNTFRPGFTANFLPSLERRLDYEPGQESVEGQEEFSYMLYDKDNRRLDNKAVINITIKGTKDRSNRDLMSFTCAWKVVLNGETISADQLILTGRESSEDSQDKTIVLHEDALHYWYLHYFVSRWSAQLDVGAAYIEYKDK
jgi:class 3 adenylate cyclase